VSRTAHADGDKITYPCVGPLHVGLGSGEAGRRKAFAYVLTAKESMSKVEVVRKLSTNIHTELARFEVGLNLTKAYNDHTICATIKNIAQSQCGTLIDIYAWMIDIYVQPHGL
jgi:hypothetical protein